MSPLSQQSCEPARPPVDGDAHAANSNVSVGRRVAKYFDDDDFLYLGTVVSIPCPGHKLNNAVGAINSDDIENTEEEEENKPSELYWHVKYDDGDEEDYDAEELAKALEVYKEEGGCWEDDSEIDVDTDANNAFNDLTDASDDDSLYVGKHEDDTAGGYSTGGKRRRRLPLLPSCIMEIDDVNSVDRYCRSNDGSDCGSDDDSNCRSGGAVAEAAALNVKRGTSSSRTKKRRKSLSNEANSGFDILPFNERIEQLKAYREKHGDCRVPQLCTDPPGLGNWVVNQRKLYAWRKRWIKMPNNMVNTLSEERIKQLEAIGFEWRSRVRKKASHRVAKYFGSALFLGTAVPLDRRFKHKAWHVRYDHDNGEEEFELDDLNRALELYNTVAMVQADD